MRKTSKGPLCLLSSHPGTGLIHTHAHTPPSTHLPTYTHTKKKKKGKTSALSSGEPSLINFFLFSLLPLMHLHHSLLTYSLPPLLSPLFPPVLALSTEKLFSLFSLCEWTRPITSLFNEHVVFSCSAHSPNTPSQHWQLSGKGAGLCVSVCMCVRERKRR